MSAPVGALFAAIAAVMGEVQYVQKTGDNKHDRYTYASDVDLLRALQPSMAKHGLAMAPTDIEVTHAEHTTKGGAVHDRADVIVTYTLGHMDGGTLEIKVPGTGVDRSDKAVYKAMTGAYKYALRQAFAVPTGDDAEADSPEARGPSHHPSWGQARGVFFAELRRLGVDYEALCTRLGARPSTWDNTDRQKMLADLKRDGHPLQAWAAAQGGGQ